MAKFNCKIHNNDPLLGFRQDGFCKDCLKLSREEKEKKIFSNEIIPECKIHGFNSEKGFSSKGVCKDCKFLSTKKSREKNKVSISIKKKNYALSNKEKIKSYQIKYRQDNNEYLLAFYKQRYIDNREEKLVWQKQYSKNNKNTIYEYRRNKYANDPNFRLRNLVSKAINRHLFLNNSSKNGKSCLNYLSYTIKELKTHIESLFEPWMNWNNHGIYDPLTFDINPTWQLDHIIPHSTFKYETMDCKEFRDCWALSNLRPYSAKQNILDGNRR